MIKKKDIKKLKYRVDALELHFHDILNDVKNANTALERVLQILTPPEQPEPVPVPVPVRPDPVIEPDPVLKPEPRGLDALFDKPPRYRHKCTACKHVRVNFLQAPQKCNQCGRAMVTTTVTPHVGKRYKRKVKPPATPAPAPAATPARVGSSVVGATG